MAEEQKPLSFIGDLSDSQAQNALIIANKAKAMHMNPRLAVAVAYREGRLNFGVDDGAAGEIGVMQVKPDTGKMLGFSEKDLRDPEKNIEAGLMYLNKGLIKYGDPKLAVAGYNAGMDHKFFEEGSNQKLPASTVKYVKEIQNWGGFTEPAASTTEPEASTTASTFKAPAPATEPASEEGFLESMAKDLYFKAKDLTLEDAAKASGAVSGGFAGPKVGKGLDYLQGVVSAKEAANLANAAKTVAVPEPSAQSVRIMQGGNGDALGTTGRARQEGYNTETARRAAVTNELKAVNPQTKQVLARAPGLTATESGVLYPTVEGRQTAGPRPQPSPLKVRGGASFSPLTSNIGGVRPGTPSAAPAPSSAVPRMGPSSAGATPFAGKVAQYGGALLNSPLGKVATGALGGYGAATQSMEAYERAKRGDQLGAAIAGVGAFGSGVAAVPTLPTRVIGGGLSMLSPAALWMLEHSRKMSPENAQGALQGTDQMGNPIP